MPAKQSKKSTAPSSSSSNHLSQLKSSNGSLHTTHRNTNKPKPKSFKPLLSVTKPPIFDVPLMGKGKAKATLTPKISGRPEVISLLDDAKEVGQPAFTQKDDRLWVDVYEPQTEAELAVHKRKVEDIRRWFQESFEGGPSGRLRKYRRILVLSGPAGTAKTTTIRVLSKELNFDILEWRSTLEESYSEDDFERESLNQKFEAFLARAGSCRPLPGGPSLTRFTSSSSSSAALTPSSPASQERKQVILLEDLPNILHQPTQLAFHSALESFVSNSQGAPLVIIISDASTRGEARDEKLARGGYSFSHDTVDVRTVLPPNLMNGPYVTQIAFNPIAPTLMLRALQELLSRYYTHSQLTVPQNKRQTKEDLSIIVETSKGDIRSAVMALQFSRVLSENTKSKVAKGKKRTARVLMEAVTRREQALALFHLMGRVLYNKRKGDPPSSSTSTKDKHREEELDARLIDLPPLPPWFAHHNRRTSRVDVDSLYTDSPIDTSLFALYVHQNYPSFCDDVGQCEELSNWLSWVDASGGEHWYQANPHQFHLLTLGTLHSLPSPVMRRGQKICKPAFFDTLKHTREAEDELADVRTWLQDQPGSTHQCWSKEGIALELGAVLKLRSTNQSGFAEDTDVPPTHSAFSTLAFSHASSISTSMLDADGPNSDEEDIAAPLSREDEGDVRRRQYKKATDEKEDEGAGWLPDDDIDEF